MIQQTIDLTDGAVEYTLPWTGTETTGKNIGTAGVQLALGSVEQPGTWRDPDRINRAGSSITASLLIGAGYKPTAGSYWLWRRITDNPEVLPARTQLNVRII